MIIAAGTDAHTKLILACVEAGLPTLCEKPVGSNGAEGAELLRRLEGSTVPVQIGFQRRYDAAIAAAKAAVESGELGWINTIRSTTLDPEPPTEAYVSVSGGMYRDCGVHDFDIIRFVTGQEAVEVYATGTNQGAEFFKKYDDPDTSAAIVTFANGTLGVVSNTRYNGRGYDVRLEVHGSKDSVAAGVDEGWPIRAAAGRRVPVRAAAPVLHGPLPARSGRSSRRSSRSSREAAVAVHRRRRAGGRLDRRGVCQVPEGAPSGAHRGGTDSSTETTEYRIAGAPISWGVCEVPGWGYQLGPDKVLAEMREVGLLATELGPDGFLPAEPDAMATVLAQHGLQAVGGFTPLLLHVPSHDPVPEVERILEGYVASNASTLVLSSVSGQDGYDSRPELDDKGWQTLLDNLSRISRIAAAKGIRAVLHPHVGTMIENTAEVQRVLDGSSINLCLDTGHLLIGGTDPAELTRQAPERVAHVHFKDVDASKAKHVQDGRWTYTEGVSRGMYRPLGTGDVDVAAIVEHLTKRGYDGWYTLEQDTILEDKPTGEGPVGDVRTSADNLRARAAEHPMTAAAEPLRVGILGAARIAELAIVKPAHATGTGW